MPPPRVRAPPGGGSSLCAAPGAVAALRQQLCFVIGHAERAARKNAGKMVKGARGKEGMGIGSDALPYRPARPNVASVEEEVVLVRVCSAPRETRGHS